MGKLYVELTLVGTICIKNLTNKNSLSFRKMLTLEGRLILIARKAEFLGSGGDYRDVNILK